MRCEYRQHFPRQQLQRKPRVSDPGMHQGTCVTHVPWCMSGSLSRGRGENVPGIPGACATRNFKYLVRGSWQSHTMKRISALLVLCEGKHLSPEVSHLKGPAMSTQDITMNTSWVADDLRLHDAHVTSLHCVTYVRRAWWEHPWGYETTASCLWVHIPRSKWVLIRAHSRCYISLDSAGCWSAAGPHTRTHHYPAPGEGGSCSWLKLVTLLNQSGKYCFKFKSIW